VGFDSGKKFKGKKRHVLVDTRVLLMDAIVHAADIQDRDGGALLMAPLFGLYPFLLKLYADAGYQGPKFQQGLARVCREVNVEIVRRCDIGKFVVLPRRWMVTACTMLPKCNMNGRRRSIAAFCASRVGLLTPGRPPMPAQHAGSSAPVPTKCPRQIQESGDGFLQLGLKGRGVRVCRAGSFLPPAPSPLLCDESDPPPLDDFSALLSGRRGSFCTACLARHGFAAGR
jgi:hypothetical protein